MWVKKMEMVRRRDAVIADLCLFYLDGPDCGTAFEVGHAAALGKTEPTFTLDWRSMREKYGGACDASVMGVEDFCLSFSPMLRDGAEALDSFDAALH
ncbi:nucleoside deoxyribosyltransferase, partial [Trypanosoma cruzi]